MLLPSGRTRPWGRASTTAVGTSFANPAARERSLDMEPTNETGPVIVPVAPASKAIE
jgi:hypothetical protein